MTGKLKWLQIVCFVVTVVAFLLGVWAGGGERLLYVAVSPDGRERVEVYTPTRLQRWVEQRKDLPGVLRLVHVSDAGPVGSDSEVIELSGAGSAIWSETTVQLGTTAVFDRKSGRWQTVP